MVKYFILLAILLTACDRSQENERAIFNIDLTDLVESTVEPINIDKWSKKVRYVPLETTDSVFIKYIQKVYLHDNKFLIVHSGRISVFDIQGRYLHDIGKKGNGPEEYADLFDLCLHGNDIYVQETPNRIKVYDREGKFMRNLRYPENIRGIYPLPDKDEIFAFIPNLFGNTPSRFYHIQGETVTDSIPNLRLYPKAVFQMMFWHEFFPTQGNRLNGFMELYNDTIYRITPKREIKPYAAVQIGKLQPTETERYGVAPGDIRKNPMEGKKPMIALGECEERIYLYSNSIVNLFFCFDKKTGVSQALEITYPKGYYSLSENARFVPRFLADDNSYLIDWEQPENDNNPVLILVEP